MGAFLSFVAALIGVKMVASGTHSVLGAGAVTVGDEAPTLRVRRTPTHALCHGVGLCCFSSFPLAFFCCFAVLCFWPLSLSFLPLSPIARLLFLLSLFPSLRGRHFVPSSGFACLHYPGGRPLLIWFPHTTLKNRLLYHAKLPLVPPLWQASTAAPPSCLFDARKHFSCLRSIPSGPTTRLQTLS